MSSLTSDPVVAEALAWVRGLWDKQPVPAMTGALQVLKDNGHAFSALEVSYAGTRYLLSAHERAVWSGLAQLVLNLDDCRVPTVLVPEDALGQWRHRATLNNPRS